MPLMKRSPGRALQLAPQDAQTRLATPVTLKPELGAVGRSQKIDLLNLSEAVSSAEKKEIVIVSFFLSEKKKGGVRGGARKLNRALY